LIRTERFHLVTEPPEFITGFRTDRQRGFLHVSLYTINWDKLGTKSRASWPKRWKAKPEIRYITIDSAFRSGKVGRIGAGETPIFERETLNIYN
jgi:hypothetical protein